MVYARRRRAFYVLPMRPATKVVCSEEMSVRRMLGDDLSTSGVYACLFTYWPQSLLKSAFLI